MVRADGTLLVELDRFETAIMDAHSPLEECFRFLCHECHMRYDARAKEGPNIG